jgi:hypothetical protein
MADSSPPPSSTPTPQPAPTPTPSPIVRQVIAYSLVPDFCKLPNGTIVPFDLISFFTDTKLDSDNVCANSHGVLRLNSEHSQSFGDESSAGGVASGTIRGRVKMLPNACTVYTNQYQTMQDGNLASMNEGNTIGIIKVLELKVEDAVGIAADIGNKYGESRAKLRRKDLEREAKKALKHERAHNRTYKGPKGEIRRLKAIARAEEELAKAANRVKSFPGAKSIPPLVATGMKKLPVAVLVYQTGDAYNDLLKGNNADAAGKAAGALTGVGVGIGGSYVCGALTLTTGVGGLACFVGVAVASTLASKKVENEVKGYLETPAAPHLTQEVPTPTAVPGPAPNTASGSLPSANPSMPTQVPAQRPAPSPTMPPS